MARKMRNQAEEKEHSKNDGGKGIVWRI